MKNFTEEKSLVIKSKEEKEMSEANKTMNKKKGLLAAVVLVLLIAAAAICYAVFSPKPVEGAKAVTIEVVDDAGETVTYDVKTDAEFLRQAMEEAEGLTFSGTESEYGLMVDTVNDLTASYEDNGAYWSFYVEGEYCNYGIDTQPVEDGQTFQIVYTTN